jgi:hypothetical protein
MNRKLKQVTPRAIMASKSLFQGSSSSSSGREAMLRCARDEQRSIAFQRSDDEEEEERGEDEERGEEERRGEEAENVGDGPNVEEEGEEAELEHVPRLTRRSHMIAPPIAPAREEDRVPIRPLGDR